MPEDNTTAPDAVTSIFILSDSRGPVGAFSSYESALLTKMKFFPRIDMLLYHFPGDPEGDREYVWIVEYFRIGSVAFASNNRAEAEEFRSKISIIELAFDDVNIDRFKKRIGDFFEECVERLEMSNNPDLCEVEEIILKQISTITNRHIMSLPGFDAKMPDMTPQLETFMKLQKIITTISEGKIPTQEDLGSVDLLAALVDKKNTDIPEVPAEQSITIEQSIVNNREDNLIEHEPIEELVVDVDSDPIETSSEV